MVRRKILGMLKRALVGTPAMVDPVTEWTKMLGGSLSFGHDTTLNFGGLVVRDPIGCSLQIGSQSDIHGTICFEKSSSRIRIGSRTHIGGATLIDAACGIEIGDDVMVSFECLIMDHNSHSVRYHERKKDVVEWQQGRKDWTHVPMAPVSIGDKAWVGARVIILKGVTIGEGAVIGAGSIVTKDVPAWSIAAGNPARVIRTLTEEERQEDRELIQI